MNTGKFTVSVDLHADDSFQTPNSTAGTSCQKCADYSAWQIEWKWRREEGVEWRNRQTGPNGAETDAIPCHDWVSPTGLFRQNRTTRYQEIRNG